MFGSRESRANASTVIQTQRVLRQSFATPQPAKKALKAPRTSLVARTKKTVRIQEASPITEVRNQTRSCCFEAEEPGLTV